ncbi:hypothetical protein GCM10011591_19720 [Nocardia camponoti]|uniref:Uncharacterized protein n=1 Tax=Nocardia camponoti TaxID=1616106 RepID=A0A917QFK6_9NOCA|nr:hypothetical protein GCM10011591_19720 [Nocardia camponoti]
MIANALVFAGIGAPTLYLLASVIAHEIRQRVDLAEDGNR